MKYEVVKQSGSYYYKGEDGKLYGEGYKNAHDFASNGLARVVKEDDLYYFINENFETVSRGFDYAGRFKEDGSVYVREVGGKEYRINGGNLGIVAAYNSEGKIMSEVEFKLGLYLNGAIEVYYLPDECFLGDYLKKIIENEKKVYEYAINMASTEEQKVKVQSDYESRADYINGRAYEIRRNRNEAYKSEEKEINS